MADPKEAAMRTRIITHMNEDHQSSLTKYLEHFAKTSSFTARNPSMVDITTSAMTIQSSGFFSTKSYTIPFSPPLKSLLEVRPRVVEMDQQATKALFREPETVTRYLLPQSYQWLIPFAFLFGLFCFSRRESFEAGSWLTSTILYPVPWLSRFLYEHSWGAFAGTVAIHVAEAAFMAQGKLKRHTVPVGGRVWWMWTISTFLEGVGALMRFDGEVQEIKKKREKAAH